MPEHSLGKTLANSLTRFVPCLTPVQLDKMITEEQKERRKNGIFASDVPRIMSGDSIRLVLEKLGYEEPASYDDVIEVEVGNILEDKILDSYQDKNPTIQIERDAHKLEFFHPDRDWQGCHLDSFWLDFTTNVEVKTVGEYNRHLWGSGGDEVPDKVIWQTEAQMAVTGIPRTEIPVCFLNSAALKEIIVGRLPPIVIFEVHADPYLQEMIKDESSYIWSCIQNKEIPAPKTIEDLRLIYRKDNGEIIQADENTFAIYQELLSVRNTKDEIEQRETDLQAQLQSAMLEASELRYGGQAITTWKKSKDGEWFDKDRFANEYPDLYRQFLKERIGSRKFLTKKWKGEINVS
jgi:predicted phage-related endonuclease